MPIGHIRLLYLFDIENFLFHVNHIQALGVESGTRLQNVTTLANGSGVLSLICNVFHKNIIGLDRGQY